MLYSEHERRDFLVPGTATEAVDAMAEFLKVPAAWILDLSMSLGIEEFHRRLVQEIDPDETIDKRPLGSLYRNYSRLQYANAMGRSGRLRGAAHAYAADRSALDGR